MVDVPVLCIGGRSMLDEAAGAMLAAVLAKRGLGAKALPPEEISAGHITTLASTKAKAVCLSYLGLGAGPAHIRYLVRRLRRILPKGTLILVAYWHEEDDAHAHEGAAGDRRRPTPTPPRCTRPSRSSSRPPPARRRTATRTAKTQARAEATRGRPRPQREPMNAVRACRLFRRAELLLHALVALAHGSRGAGRALIGEPPARFA